MKRYKKYMSGVNAPDTLQQRLRELKAPEKRPAPWAKYGSVAAALVLVFGGLSVGIHRHARESGYVDSLFHETSHPEIEAVFEPDIALEAPGDVTEPGEKTLGGYEVAYGSGSEAMVSYYVLPYIEYGEVPEGDSIMGDWGLPNGVTQRDLSQDEIIALMGGGDAVNTHLDWGEYDLSGWGAWYEDGSFWGAYIDGQPSLGNMKVGGISSHFEFAVTADQLPPTCFGYPNSVTQEIRGLEVTADKSDWEEHIFSWPTYIHERRVSFMKDGYGYRFEMTSGDLEEAELLVSRLVRQIADEGLDLSAVAGTAMCQPEEGTYVCAYCGHVFPVGSVHGHPFIGADATYTCDVCGNTFPVGAVHNDPDVDGTAATEPYDPNEAADPLYHAPGTSVCEVCGESVREGGVHFHMVLNGDGTYTCDSCGVTLPEGERHYHNTADDGMCSGYPAPGPVESWQVCALPLAPPDTAIDTIID